MPIDPTAEEALAIMSKSRVDTDNASTDEIREAMKAALAAVAADPVDVAIVQDRTIPTPAGDLPVRIYWPAGTSDAPLPVFLYLHSGGYVIYDINTADPQCRLIANEAGCIVVSLGYRLAPEAKFPAPVDDCCAAHQWIAENAPSFQGDPKRIAIGGESCGGTISSVAAIIARDAGGPTISLIVMICPLTELIDPSGDDPMSRMARRFKAYYLNEEAEGRDFRASPQYADDVSNLPPHLIVTGEFDPLLAQGEAHAEKQKDAGVSVEIVCFDGMIHNFPSMGGTIPKAGEALSLIARSLGHAFAG